MSSEHNRSSGTVDHSCEPIYWHDPLTGQSGHFTDFVSKCQKKFSGSGSEQADRDAAGKVRATIHFTRFMWFAERRGWGDTAGRVNSRSFTSSPRHSALPRPQFSKGAPDSSKFEGERPLGTEGPQSELKQD